MCRNRLRQPLKWVRVDNSLGSKTTSIHERFYTLVFALGELQILTLLFVQLSRYKTQKTKSDNFCGLP